MMAHIVVQGLVQGVGYRFFVMRKAQEYRIRGYVRNLPDRNVEVVAQGEKGLVHEFIEQLKVGPASAHVTGIDVEWSEQEPEFIDFDVKF
jgi:acylphosphatase